MALDTFERYKHNLYLSPISPGLLERLGQRCGLSPDSLVLDAGCGKGGAGLTLAARFGCQVTGTDSRAEFVEESRRRAMFEDLAHRANFLHASWDDLPFDEDFFDLALMLGPAEPADPLPPARHLGRVVRPGGWVAASALVRKGDAEAVPAAVRDWLAGFPTEIHDAGELRRRFEREGFAVEATEEATEASWENFYAPQARVIMENRLALAGEREARATLDAWQKDLERYHSGGGRESLAYACFLLRRPPEGDQPQANPLH